MINPAELVRRPVREGDLLPVATDEQVSQYFQGKIEDIRLEVESRIKLRQPRFTSNLLHMSGEEEHSIIGGLRVERDRAQQLLFKVMGDYGFDQDKSMRQFKMDTWSGKIQEDITKNIDGVTREAFIHPSQTIKGLNFRRTVFFITETGQPTDVFWEAVNTNPKYRTVRVTPRIALKTSPQ